LEKPVGNRYRINRRTNAVPVVVEKDPSREVNLNFSLDFLLTPFRSLLNNVRVIIVPARSGRCTGSFWF
jgi:hypothetical protein